MSVPSGALKKMRVKKDMTQDEVADLMHVTRGAVSLWENGKREPDVDTLTKLAKLYNVSLDELITGVKEEKYRYRYKKRMRNKMICLSIIIFLVFLFRKIGMALTYYDGEYDIPYMLINHISKTFFYLFVPMLVTNVVFYVGEYSIEKRVIEKASLITGIILVIGYYFLFVYTIFIPVRYFTLNFVWDWAWLIMMIAGVLLFVGTFSIQVIPKKKPNQDVMPQA